MYRDRFQLIHHFFSLNVSSMSPNTLWFYRIQYISDLIRTACQNVYIPSFHITIDEVMMAFERRLNHMIKFKNKSIINDYKLWCIDDHGYIWNWLFHSRVNGIETFVKGQQTRWSQQQDADVEIDFDIEKNALLAPTYVLVLRLVVQLPKLKFCIHLDNLFLNVLVV